MYPENSAVRVAIFGPPPGIFRVGNVPALRRMSFSYAEKHTPFVLSPESLDQHLAAAWYRMGSSIFTTHFLFFNGRPYSAIWIRLDLRSFTFSKSQRKLLRRNGQLFSTRVGPRVIDAEREALYEAYADDFDGRLSATISDSLEDYGEESVFNTHEVTVRDRVSKELVATSYFDIGDNSAASILGIYRPLLKQFSLGYYTMLLEIESCLERGLRYYYPGYVVPGYRRFDYKLRLGNSQYFDIRTSAWLPYAGNTDESIGPTERQLSALSGVVALLKEHSVERRVLTYPLFEADLYDAWNDDYLPYPYFVFLGADPSGNPVVLVFDPKSDSYQILHCAHMVQPQLLFNAGYLSNFAEDDFYAQLLSVKSLLYRAGAVGEVVDVILHGLGRDSSD